MCWRWCLRASGAHDWRTRSPVRRRGDGVQRTRCLPLRLASVVALANAERLKLGVKLLSERCQIPMK